MQKALRPASARSTIQILRRLLAADWRHASKATWDTRTSRYLHRKLSAEEAKQQGQYYTAVFSKLQKLSPLELLHWVAKRLRDAHGEETNKQWATVGRCTGL